MHNSWTSVRVFYFKDLPYCLGGEHNLFWMRLWHCMSTVRFVQTRTQKIWAFTKIVNIGYS
jgi:hypothetical protein